MVRRYKNFCHQKLYHRNVWTCHLLRSYTRSPRRETEGEAHEGSHKLKFGSSDKNYNVSERKDTKVGYSKELDIMEISASSEEPGSVVVKEDESLDVLSIPVQAI